MHGIGCSCELKEAFNCAVTCPLDFIQVMVLFVIGCIWILSISGEFGLLVFVFFNHSILVQINAPILCTH